MLGSIDGEAKLDEIGHVVLNDLVVSTCGYVYPLYLQFSAFVPTEVLRRVGTNLVQFREAGFLDLMYRVGDENLRDKYLPGAETPVEHEQLVWDDLNGARWLYEAGAVGGILLVAAEVFYSKFKHRKPRRVIPEPYRLSALPPIQHRTNGRQAFSRRAKSSSLVVA